MKNKLSTLIAFVATILMVFSCTEKKYIYEDPNISISNEVISFNNSAGADIIKVTTNKANWVATSPAEGDWLEIVKKNDNLTINVAANESGSERATVVMFNAMGAGAKLRINQSAGDIYLNIDIDKNGNNGISKQILSDARKQTLLVKMLTNAKEVSVENNADWFKVKPFTEAKLLQLMISENKSTNERTAEFTIKADTLTKTFTLIQEGIKEKENTEDNDDNKPGIAEQLRFPSLDINQDTTTLKANEAKQGRIYLGSRKTGKGSLMLDFQTDSKLMSLIRYMYTKPENKKWKMAATFVNATNGFELTREEFFQNKLKALGFAKIDSNKEDEDNYISKKWNMMLSISKMKDKNEGKGFLFFMSLNKEEEEGGNDNNPPTPTPTPTPTDGEFYFAMPSNKATIEKLIAFEEGRGNTAKEKPFYGEKVSVIVKDSRAKYQTFITYIYDKRTEPTYAFCSADISKVYKGWEIVQTEKFKKELKANGYDVDNPVVGKEFTVYRHANGEVECSIAQHKDYKTKVPDDGAVILFTPVVERNRTSIETIFDLYYKNKEKLINHNSFINRKKEYQEDKEELARIAGLQ